MKKVFALLVVSALLAAGSLYAQTGGHQDGGTAQQQQNKPMTKEQLADAISQAHHLTNLYYFRYARVGGSNKEYRAYIYWLTRRQELLKEYNGTKSTL